MYLLDSATISGKHICVLSSVFSETAWNWIPCEIKRIFFIQKQVLSAQRFQALSDCRFQQGIDQLLMLLIVVRGRRGRSCGRCRGISSLCRSLLRLANMVFLLFVLRLFFGWLWLLCGVCLWTLWLLILACFLIRGRTALVRRGWFLLRRDQGRSCRFRRTYRLGCSLWRWFLLRQALTLLWLQQTCLPRTGSAGGWAWCGLVSSGVPTHWCPWSGWGLLRAPIFTRFLLGRVPSSFLVFLRVVFAAPVATPVPAAFGTLPTVPSTPAATRWSPFAATATCCISTP